MSKYPIRYRHDSTKIVVEFTGLTEGVVIDCGGISVYSDGFHSTTWRPHTEFCWTQVESKRVLLHSRIKDFR